MEPVVGSPSLLFLVFSPAFSIVLSSLEVAFVSSFMEDFVLVAVVSPFVVEGFTVVVDE